jgi:hypothetical protein
MTEQPKFPEMPPVTEDEVIDALNAGGVEDPDARVLLERYTDQCQAEADAEAARGAGDPVASLRANILCAVKLTRLYSRTERYTLVAREELEDALLTASQNESTRDLAREIENLIKAMNFS